MNSEAAFFLALAVVGVAFFASMTTMGSKNVKSYNDCITAAKTVEIAALCRQ